jgi:hypothetical protein
VFVHPQLLQYHIHQQDTDVVTIFTVERSNKLIYDIQKQISNQFKELKINDKEKSELNLDYFTQVTLVLSEQIHSTKLPRVLCIVVVVLLPLPKICHCKCMFPSILDYSILFQDVLKWTNCQMLILTDPIKQMQG